MFRTVALLGGLSCVGALLLSVCTPSLLAQVMQSGSFQIQSDSVNFGGGISTSSSYVLESTAGEVATGESLSSNYQLKAGYQQMQNVSIALGGATPVVLTPSLGGVSGGVSNGSTTVTVTTDSPGGYTLSIESSSSPSMQAPLGATISDYVPGGNPDYTFTFAAGQARFGFTPEGVDVVTRFLDDGISACNTGSVQGIATCWDGLGTTAQVIAQSSDPNHPQGSTTTVRFRVGVGATAVPVPGIYTATTTLTALAL